MKPWSRQAVEFYGWPPLLGGPVVHPDPPRTRVYWYQATMGEGLAHWECTCGSVGDSLSLLWARIRLWWHCRTSRHR